MPRGHLRGDATSRNEEHYVESVYNEANEGCDGRGAVPSFFLNCAQEMVGLANSLFPERFVVS